MAGEMLGVDVDPRDGHGGTISRLLPLSVSLARPDAPLGDLDELLRDIDCYLVAVDLFRALGHEPIWRCDELIAPSMPWP
jgi:hypothetical protein